MSLVTITLTNSVANLCNIKWTGNNDKLRNKPLVDTSHSNCEAREEQRFSSLLAPRHGHKLGPFGAEEMGQQVSCGRGKVEAE